MVLAPMDWQGWFTIAVIVLVVAALARGIAAPDLVVMAGLFSLAAVGILTPGETFSGFANPAMATVGALFVVSAGLRETGALDAGIVRLFGGARSEFSALLRMCPPLAGMSAFLNNAPIVAMMTPVVIEWARRHSIAPSRLLAPLSYATILGSVTTLIGTSVNLTVAGLLLKTDLEPMGLFELAPCCLRLLLLLNRHLSWTSPSSPRLPSGALRSGPDLYSSSAPSYVKEVVG